MSEKSGMPRIGHRVLIVEDEYFLAEEISDALSDVGVEVAGPVATARDALDLIDQGGIDAAIIDINLRGHFAFDVADALVAQGVPYCFATGYDKEVIPERFRDIVRFEKPVSMRAMVATLEGLRPPVAVQARA